jgi:hypothetical protein
MLETNFFRAKGLSFCQFRLRVVYQKSARRTISDKCWPSEMKRGMGEPWVPEGGFFLCPCGQGRPSRRDNKKSEVIADSASFIED